MPLSDWWDDVLRFDAEGNVLFKTWFTFGVYNRTSGVVRWKQPLDSAMAKYNNKFWGGVNYRVQDAVSIIIGMQYRNLNIGYSYDITTSALGSQGRSSGSHEIMIGYCFKIEIEKPRRSYKNTRFL